MTIFQAIIIAIVEGITEFLPVSSTGHMIITTSVMGISSDEFTKMFTIAIQFGAILSVLALYWRKFLRSFDFYVKLFIAFIPSAIIGFLLNDYIDALLENVIVVAVMLLVGGIFLLFVDKMFPDANEPGDQEHKISYKRSLSIGFFQVIAMIPGVSRSAATIIGGLTQKLNRQTAAEFSFFLAVPTMFAATAYKLYKGIDLIQKEHINLLLIGNVVAFIVALIAIKSFISFLTKHGFKLFGYYRIVLGLAILILYFMGVELSTL